MPLGEDTVAFAEEVQAEGVSVRPFPGDGARVTIGESEANNLFLEVAIAWRQGRNPE
jgi:histidinol-phosphate aminotransferase